jgi:hypothetical protein
MLLLDNCTVDKIIASGSVVHATPGTARKQVRDVFRLITLPKSASSRTFGKDRSR